MKKWLKWLLSIILLLIIITLVSFKLYFHVKIPEKEGVSILPALHADVEVITDNYGVPHIYADNNHDLFCALGYIHASQRLFQMDQMVRVAEGRLSEAFGSKLIELDVFMRTLGIRQITREITPKLNPEVIDIIKAYVEGVNTYIDLNEHNLPVEFRLARYKPMKWTPQDCISFVRLMGWDLTQSWNAEIVFYKLLEIYGADKTREVLPTFIKDWPESIPDHYAGLSDALSYFREQSIAAKKFLGVESSNIGSNNWSLSGMKTETGAPILCNDPHLSYSQPAVWFEVHLVSPDIDVAGVTFPGLPGVVIGHNQNIAWGFTNMMTNDVDFYVETISRERDKYFYNGKWESIAERDEIIRIKDKPDTTITIYSTRNGPIINNIHKLLNNSDDAVSMRWTGQDFSDEFKGMLDINRAKNWDEFRKAAQYYKVPGQNVAYADVDGNIALVSMGNVPIRKGGEMLLPLPGDDPKYTWQKYIPYDEMPYILNPEIGFVVSTNVRFYSDNYPYYISNHYEPSYRFERIEGVLSENKKFSIEDMKKLQLDDYSLYAKEVLKYFFEAVPDTELTDLLEKKSYKSLKAWDFHDDIHSFEATIFNTMIVEMMGLIYKDEMDLAGEDVFEQFLSFSSFPIRNSMELLKRGESSWFDNILTRDVVERRKDILMKSFENAIGFLRKDYSPNFSEWEWGKIHTLTHNHPLGKVRIIDKLFRFNVGPFPSPGSEATVNCGAFSLNKPLDKKVGPSLRFIMPLDDLENIYSVIPTGQSGIPNHPNYDDQALLYNSGQYKIVTTNRFKLMKDGAKVLTLKP